MNRKILGIAVTLLAIAMLASPVVAVGPLKPLENGNDRFTGSAAGGVVMKDAGPNTVIYITDLFDVPEENNEIFHDVKATKGAGRMNNAIIVKGIPDLMAIGANEEDYFNKWVYLSGDNTAQHPNDYQAGGHGMLYYFAEKAFGVGSGPMVVAEHPDGIFAMWHHVAGDSK